MMADIENPSAIPQGNQANTLLAAGFSPEEVSGWAAQQRPILSAAGFSEPEIDQYIGGPPKPPTPGLAARLDRGKLASQALSKIGDALAQLPLAQQTRGFAKGAFTDSDPDKAAGIIDALQRLPEDAGWFIGRQLRHMVEGVPTPEQAQRIGESATARVGEGSATREEIVNMAMSSLWSVAPTRLPGGFARIERSPLGEIRSVPVGDLPKPEDFANSTRVTLGDEPSPQAFNKLERLWDEHGVHPAEVAHDAANDVTITQDLAGADARLPETYLRFAEPAAQSAGTPALERIPKEPRRLVEFLRGEGGLQDQGGEISHTIGGINQRPGLINRNGMTLDDATMRAWEEGYFPELSERPTTNDLIDAVRDDINGRRKYANQDEAQAHEYHAAIQHNSEIDRLAGEHGIDYRGMSREAFWSEIGDRVSLNEAARLSEEAATAHEAAMREVDGLVEPGGLSYEVGSRSLEDLDREYRQEEIAGRTPARASGAEQPGSASASQGGSEASVRPSGNGARLGSGTAEVAGGSGVVRGLLRSEEGALRLGRPPPPRDPAQQAMLDRLSIGETDNARPWSWDRFYTAVVDRLNPIEKIVKATGEKPIAADDPYQLARLYAGVSGKADQWLNHSTFTFDTYANSGKSLKEILAGVDDLDGFRAFATALRAMELEERGIKTGMDMSAAQTVALRDANKYAPVMKELVGYQDRLLRYLRDAGVLSDQSVTAIRAQNQLYVPFQRVFGDVVGDIIPDVVRGEGTSLQAHNPIHAIEGSGRRVIDPLESIIRNTYLSLAMAERNAVGLKFVDLIQRAGHLPIPARTDTISVYRNGVKETHSVSVDLAAAVKGLDEEATNTLTRMLGVQARMLRAGATLSPDFMLRNPIRDFFSAVVNTTKGVFSPFDTMRGLMSAIYKDAEFQEWQKGGGANSMLVSLDRRYLQQNIADLTAQTGLGSRAWNVVQHPIDTLRAVSMLTEQATRLGEFQAARQRALARGQTAKEAAQEAAMTSREVTIDFARRGSMTRSMNMITAFWNAQVQGVDRLGRAFRDDPGGTTAKIAVGITIPSVLLWLSNHNDPRWKEIPDWERDLFWIVMTENHIFRIPKPFEMGVVFGSGAERLLDAFFDKKPEAFSNFAKSIFGALTPSVIPTVAVPFIEQLANRSTFTDRPLVPQAQEKHLPEYQYTPYTTETAKALGRLIGAFPGIRDAKLSDAPGAGVARALSTPILLENYTRAWSGGLGMYALQLADAGLRKTGVVPDPVKPADTLADIPVVKAFVVRYPSAGAESIQQFYDKYDQNKRYFDTWMSKAKDGDLAAVQHIQDMGGPRMFVQLDAIKDTMTKHSQLVRLIDQNQQIGRDEKRQLIDQLYSSETQIAARGLDAMRQIEKALAMKR